MIDLVFRTSTVLSVSLISAAATAEVIDTFELGEGDSTSSLVFEFSNGNQYLYEVSYTGPMTGREVFDVIEAAQADYFIADITTYTFGDALSGLTIGSDSDTGFGSTPPDYLDYWHYWGSDGESSPWEMAGFGFSDRDLFDGSRDGWVFGSDNVPIAAGGTVLAMLGVSMVGRRRD